MCFVRVCARTLRNISVVLIPIVVLMAFPVRAGSIPAPYEVGTWQGFRPIAVSFTFDDSCPNQFALAIPMFDQAGLKMTLFSCTGTLFAGWPKLQSAAAKGHEIASHTVTHSDMSTMSAASQTNELKNSQDAINANVTTQKCVTMAYPYCNQGIDAITSTYYQAARTCSGQIVPSTPANFMAISSFVCGSAGSVQTFQQFTNTANSAMFNHGWCVYLIHGIDNDGGYSPVPSSTLQTTVNYFSGAQARYWVQTFGNVVRYIRERNAASVTELSNTESSITLRVTDTLDDATYNYPITLRRPLPSGWPAANVFQNNKSVAAQIVTINSTNFIMFDVVPDAGNVILSKTALPPVLGNPVLETPSSFNFRLDGQAGASYAIYSSGDLLNWLPIQTNTLVGTSTNLRVEASDSQLFYRAVWMP
jgi:hypothetical protein